MIGKRKDPFETCSETEQREAVLHDGPVLRRRAKRLTRIFGCQVTECQE